MPGRAGAALASAVARAAGPQPAPVGHTRLQLVAKIQPCFPERCEGGQKSASRGRAAPASAARCPNATKPPSPAASSSRRSQILAAGMITLVNIWRNGVPKRFLIEVNAAWSSHATTEADRGGRPGSGLWDLPAWTTRYRHLLQRLHISTGNFCSEAGFFFLDGAADEIIEWRALPRKAALPDHALKSQSQGASAIPKTRDTPLMWQTQPLLMK